MTSEIKSFPIAQHIGIVDQVTFGYVARKDQPGAGIPYLQQAFADLAKNRLDLGICETDVRAELLDLHYAIVTHAYNLFDLQLHALEVDVPSLDVSLVYDRQTLNAG